MDYDAYLQSPRWRRRRRAFAQRHPRICACGTSDRLHLHHRSYERLGAELDGDLMWLCERCHSLVHQLVAEGQIDLACEQFFDDARAVDYYTTRLHTRPDVAAATVEVTRARAALEEARRHPRVKPQTEQRRRNRILKAMQRLTEARIALALAEGDETEAARLRQIAAGLAA